MPDPETQNPFPCRASSVVGWWKAFVEIDHKGTNGLSNL